MPKTNENTSNQTENVSNAKAVENNVESEQSSELDSGLSLSVCGTAVSGDEGQEISVTITPFAGATISGMLILENDAENDVITGKYEEVTLTLSASIPGLDEDITVQIEDFYADSDGKITGTFTEDADFLVLGGKKLSLEAPEIDKEDASSDFEITAKGTVQGADDPSSSVVPEATIGAGGINWAADAGWPTVSFEFGEYFSMSDGMLADYDGEGAGYAHLVTGGLIIKAGDVVESSEDATVTAKYNTTIDDGEISIDGDLTLSVMGQAFTLSALTYDAPTGTLSGDSAELAITIAGHEEVITITKPSITKDGSGMSFDFESAESMSETEHEMFNGIVTMGPHSIVLEKTPDGNTVEAEGTLKVSPIPELSGEVEGGFTYSKADGLKPTFSSGVISLDKEFQPFPGVSISDLFLGVEKDEEENTNFVGGGTLKLAMNTPKIEATGEEMKLLVDSKTKAVSFEVASITLTSGLGDIEVTNLAYADGELEAEEGKFEFDSAKITDGDYFGGAAASMMGALKGLGVKFDITASDITVSKEKGFKIGKTEKKLNEIKIAILGAEAIYNIKEKKASIEKEMNILEMLTGSDSLGIELLFPLFPGVFATFGAGVKNGGSIAMKIELAKTDENFWDLLLEADLAGTTLLAYIEGGVSLGAGWLASVYAKLGAAGGVKLDDPSKLTATSHIQTSSPDGKLMLPKPKNINVDMELTLPVILQLYLTLGFQALKFFKFEYTKTLLEKELIRFNPKKTFSWQAGTKEPAGGLGASDILNKDKSDAPIQDYKPDGKKVEEISKFTELGDKMIKTSKFSLVDTIIAEVDESLKLEDAATKGGQAEELAFLKHTKLKKGTQDKTAWSFFNVSQADAEEFDKYVNKIGSYRELEEIVGPDNLNAFMEKMFARDRIFTSARTLRARFTDWHVSGNRGNKQVQDIKDFIAVYRLDKSSLND